MNKTIFAERKELKKNAHKVIRSHFVVLVFLMLVLVLFGTEFRTSLSGWGQNQLLSSSDADTETDAGNDPGNMLAVVDTFSISDVIEGIWNDDLTKETSKAAARERKLREKLGNSKALGMTNGVLGQVVGSIASGAFLVRLGQTIRTVTQSGRITGIIFTVGAFLWYALGFILLKNVCSAIVRRLFLEARIYSRVFFGDAGWFATVRKWLRASWTMFVKYVYITLWSLTIVGGVIKFFSYWAVPYIVAENPSLTSGEAISLSRKMMNGHKVELLEYYITLWGWVLLGAVTLGLSDLVYGNAYRMCCYTEFYARVREEFLQREPENAGLLNDEYLFRQADRITLYETYFDVVDEVVLIHEGKVELSGWRKKVADWFGIWLYTVDKKKAYDEQEGRKFALEHDRQCMRGEAYPQRLNPLYKEKRPGKPVKVSFLRNYTVWTLFLLFITFCFVGWSWEVALHFMQTGQFANRGTLHGPWLPIYGAGGVIVLIFCSRFRKNPVVEFFTAVALCGILEYFSAWYLETKFHQRWWSYDGYFLNLHGRICAEGLLIFGVGCCAVVYLLAPSFDQLVSKLRKQILIGLCLVLGVLFGIDEVYSMKHPNMAEGAVESAEGTEETPEEVLPDEPPSV